jgi:hypothetical protein
MNGPVGEPYITAESDVPKLSNAKQKKNDASKLAAFPIRGICFAECT